MRQNTVYLAGPITSCSYGEATDWRESLKQEIESETNGKVKCLSPMRGKHYLQSCQDINATGNEKIF